MELVIAVTRAPEGSPLQGQEHVFSSEGGSIGRSESNALVLPDPERYISSQHADIANNGTGFVLTDTSTNGVYVNGASAPVGKGQQVTLNGGDRLQIGEYELSLSLRTPALDDGVPLGSADFLSGDKTMMVNEAGGNEFDQWLEPQAPPKPSPSAPLGGLAQGEPLHLQEEEKDPLALFDREAAPTPQWDAPAAPEDDGGWWKTSQGDHAPADSHMMKVPQAIPDDWDDDLLGPQPTSSPDQTSPGVVSQPEPPPAPAVPKATAPVAPPEQARPPQAPAQPPQTPAQPIAAPASAPWQAGAADAADQLESLLARLGLSQLPAAEQAAAAEQAIDMLLASVDGMMSSLRARSAIKNEFRMNMTTIQAAENNPLKFAVSPQEAIHNMFTKAGMGYMQPLQAVQDGFQDLADHQLALLEGIRLGFEHALNTFDPARLAQRFEKQKSGGLLAGKKGKNWEAYTEFYGELSKDREQTFQRLFGEDFAQAYELKMAELKSRRGG